LILNFKIR